MKKKSGGSVSVVQVANEEGQVTEITDQQEVEQEIWRQIHGKRFYLAEQAPICQGRLRGDFGYLANTRAAEQVLAGTYNPDEEIDEGTRGLFDEIAAIRAEIPKNSVDTLVKHPIWQQRWKKAQEKTSSSESGRHMAASDSELISYCHALLAAIAVKRGYSPSRWERALSCMLEKIPGCSLVEKMRAILLMEADFNFINKTLIGSRMLNIACSYGYMAKEIFSERGRTAEDGAQAKVLFYDIVRQFRLAADIASVDAANCYDSTSQ
jgi:hypothetical protein